MGTSWLPGIVKIKINLLEQRLKLSWICSWFYYEEFFWFYNGLLNSWNLVMCWMYGTYLLSLDKKQACVCELNFMMMVLPAGLTIPIAVFIGQWFFFSWYWKGLICRKQFIPPVLKKVKSLVVMMLSSGGSVWCCS